MHIHKIYKTWAYHVNYHQNLYKRYKWKHTSTRKYTMTRHIMHDHYFHLSGLINYPSCFQLGQAQLYHIQSFDTDILTD